ncbi:type II toxin-antitoxin system VapC family toxin, partial [Candidatus Parabeggiatoa sp. HSG14]|uniref:type II toxin-antitoxin system VapC family toxin n=1 Tax=Candidatus Parabeggiatoa sp. HSG14 TaxID=3055593 RepID=UPI0025A6DF09|nr:type II toxin-antitoxin system VapC family toxin [Thiotrichales bacterium HSG14]
NQKNSTILQKFTTIPRQDVVLCDIVKFELYYGAYKSSRKTQNLVVLDDFLTNLRVYLLIIVLLLSKRLKLGQHLPLKVHLLVLMIFKLLQSLCLRFCKYTNYPLHVGMV